MFKPIKTSHSENHADKQVQRRQTNITAAYEPANNFFSIKFYYFIWNNFEENKYFVLSFIVHLYCFPFLFHVIFFLLTCIALKAFSLHFFQ